MIFRVDQIGLEPMTSRLWVSQSDIPWDFVICNHSWLSVLYKIIIFFESQIIPLTEIVCLRIVYAETPRLVSQKIREIALFLFTTLCFVYALFTQIVLIVYMYKGRLSFMLQFHKWPNKIATNHRKSRKTIVESI